MGQRTLIPCLARAARKYWFNADVGGDEQPPNLLNNESLLAINAAGTGTVALIKADTGNDVRIGPGVDTIVKVFNRPTTDAVALQVKSEYTGTASGHNCLEVTADCKSALAAGGGNTAVQGVSRLAATFTATGGNLIGTYGQVCNLGTLNGAGIMLAGVYGLIEDGGTYTAVSHVAAGWFDSHLTKTVSSGTASLLYLTNNGTTTLNSVFFIYPGNKITNLFNIDSTDTGLVSANTAGAVSGITNWRKITCVIHGETHYLIAAKAVA